MPKPKFDGIEVPYCDGTRLLCKNDLDVAQFVSYALAARFGRMLPSRLNLQKWRQWQRASTGSLFIPLDFLNANPKQAIKVPTTIISYGTEWKRSAQQTVKNKELRRANSRNRIEMRCVAIKRNTNITEDLTENTRYALSGGACVCYERSRIQ